MKEKNIKAKTPTKKQSSDDQDLHRPDRRCDPWYHSLLSGSGQQL